MKDFSLFSVLGILEVFNFNTVTRTCPDNPEKHQVELFIKGRNFDLITDLVAGTKKLPREQYEVLSSDSLIIYAEKCTSDSALVAAEDILKALPNRLYTVVPPSMIGWSGVAFTTLKAPHQTFYGVDIIIQRILLLLHDGTDVNPRTELTTPTLSLAGDVDSARLDVLRKLKDIERVISKNITDYGFSSITLDPQSIKRSDDSLLISVDVTVDNHHLIVNTGV